MQSINSRKNGTRFYSAYKVNWNAGWFKKINDANDFFFLQLFYEILESFKDITYEWFHEGL